MFKARIEITLRPSILDPQGKAAHHALHELGAATVERVRIGKYVELWIQADTEDAARATAQRACEQLLANPVMEDFAITLEPVSAPAS
ncbi:MAG: phosphoribosylformylglycinamidine synthase subunit PurS [Bacteroidota bacterium]